METDLHTSSVPVRRRRMRKRQNLLRRLRSEIRDSRMMIRRDGVVIGGNEAECPAKAEYNGPRARPEGHRRGLEDYSNS